jgi:enediyne polyketide synthase
VSLSASITPIAVIGMACWYPGARNPRQLWENVLARRMQFRKFPAQRMSEADYYHSDQNIADKTYLLRAAFIDGFNFDWASYRIPFSTFKSTDITHWISLEVALQAIADAGFSKENISGDYTGVIVGNTLTGEQSRSHTMRLRWPYVRRAFWAAAQERGLSESQIKSIDIIMESYYKSVFSPPNEDTLAGSLSNTIAGRICNFFNFHGGGYTVDGACSSSLLAVATAATGLAKGDFNLALAGGVDISLDPFELVGFARIGALSREDMNVYDRRGSGFIPGEGCGFVVLKRLEDARRDNNYIYAVLHGWGISSDGSGTGIMTPTSKGQARSLRNAYALAYYGMESLNFIEGHGTGTTVGDRVELSGISMAMTDSGPVADRSCGVTSLKSIIGHTKAASGIGGFIKAVIAVNRRIVPPTASCQEPHPIFDTQARCLYPVLHGEVFEKSKILRAGVSAMGFGGINCHITLESGDAPSPALEPIIEERSLLVSYQDTELFVFTSDSLAGLEKKVSLYLEISKEMSIAELTDLAEKLSNETDKKSEYRGAVIAGRPEELHQRLEKLIEMTRSNSRVTRSNSDRTVWLGSGMKHMRIGMLFPGQGSQQLNMARTLVQRFPWAREIVTCADQWIVEAGYRPIKDIIYRPLERAADPEEEEKWFTMLSLTENAQPAICLASLLWSQFLNKLGIFPEAVGGHSLGELTAFYAAQCFDIRELIQLAAVRGHAMAASGDRAGAMVSLRCSKEEADELITIVTGYIVMANINSPHQIILSGEMTALEDAIQKAAKKGIAARRLMVSNGFHSRLVASAAEALSKEKLLHRSLPELNIRLFSSMTGKFLEPGISLRQHFSKQILSPVNFLSMIRSMAEACDLFIEVGPGQVLSNLVNDITGPKGPRCVPIESRPSRDHDLNTMMAELFTHGVDINWSVLYEKRLIRPFVPPSERLFIENPCEHPFENGAVSPVISKSTGGGIMDDLLADLLPISDDDLAAYLKSRGPFLAEVIKADLKYSLVHGAARELVQVQKTDSSQQPAAITFEDKILDSQNILYGIIQKTTGFQSETLSRETRLLDDLNLDSIKAGDLIARFAQEYGIAGKLDPAALTNATLQEIIDTAMRLKHEAEAESPSIQIEEPQQEEKTLTALEVVLNQASKITGYPRESLDADALVQEHLNLNEEILMILLQRLSIIFSVETYVDLQPLRRRSLRQIAEVFERMVKNQYKKKSFPSPLLPDLGSWVREFTVDFSEEKQSSLPVWWGKRQEDDWHNANCLIISDPGSSELIEALRRELLRQGATVQVLTFKEENNQRFVQDPAFSHIIAILPQAHDKESDGSSLYDHVHRLASTSSPPPSSKAPRRRTTVVYVQFGGGYFGRHPEFSYFNQCCTTSLAASLHLERDDLRVRVLDFSPTIPPELTTEKCITEINTPEPFAAVGFDYKLTRRVEKVKLLQPAAYRKRPHKWSKDDVVLVTGGARGITALCALGLAQATGVRIALIGRSPHAETEPHAKGSQDIADTLQAYKDRGLIAHYFSCDVTDRDAVHRMIHQVRQKMGSITGVVHGAGLNIPRLASQSNPEAILKEVSPKVTGALHLISALKKSPLKLFVGLTSVIGVTGMPGSSWYGFSNEALDIILHRFEAEHPQTKTQSIAYSVWQDVGMGARLGSIDKLKKMGIDAIAVKEGVHRFVRLFLNNPDTHQVIVTARLRNLDTWIRTEISSVPENVRYLEEMVINVPGVESVFKAHLTLKQDLYLKDHLFNGVYLMPAVFGLEAMVQAAAHVSGITDFSRVQITNIKLDRPITVDPYAGANIVIRAEVEEQHVESSTQVIHTTIYKAHSGINESFFSATFTLGLMDKPLKHEIPVSQIPPAIKPESDLYRKTLLFQGPLFQRIEKVLALEASEESGKYASFITKMVDHIHAGKEAFLNSHHQTILLSDPFFRDSLLQSTALLIPQDTSLPVYIDQLDIFPHSMEEKEEMIWATVRLEHVTAKEIEATVTAVDSNGAVLETIKGFKLSILQHHDDYPAVSDLIKPEQRDTLLIKQALDRIKESFTFEMPEVLLQYIPGIHSLPQEEKHQRELSLMQEVVRNAIKDTPELSKDFKVTWLDSGKPAVAGLEHQEIDISFSHDERLCLTVAGTGPQGCDIAPITSRTQQEWTALLGDKQHDLLMSLLDSGDTLNLAGTRIWAAMETLYKAGNNNKDILLDIFLREKEYVILQSKNPEISFKILTVPVDLTWGPERILSLAVHQRMVHISGQNEKDILSSIIRDYEDILNIRHMEVRKEPGPQGQPVLINRIPVAFRPAAHLSGNVYFFHYFFWVGEIREFSVWPIMEKIEEMISTGKWGLITNFTELKIVGETRTWDTIEVHVWVSDYGGPENSTIELTLDFRKNLPDGSPERLAWCVQQSTWVRILEHGVVRPGPYPDFYWEFIKKTLPRFDAPNIAQPLLEPLAGIHEQTRCEKEQYHVPSGPIVKPLLCEKRIETSFDTSNTVGNIYYANYYVWQGQVRDSYFFKLIPECFRGIGDNGELLCLETRVNHLREAMPFDTIVVTMALKALKTSSATFYFEYFRLEHNSTRVKLAFGEHNAAWVVRDSQGRPSLAPFPAKVQEALQQAIEKISD